MASTVALVAGASPGIGTATAVAPRELGHAVYAAARRVDRMGEPADLGAPTPAMDVPDDESTTGGGKRIIAAAGRLDMPDRAFDALMATSYRLASR